MTTAKDSKAAPAGQLITPEAAVPQPEAAGDSNDWWNMPCYGTDVMDLHRGLVTVTLSDGIKLSADERH